MKDLIYRLIQCGIHLENEGGKLQIYDHEDKLNDEIISEIKQNKAELLNFLSQHNKTSENWNSIPLAPVKESYELSSTQQRMYFLYELNKDSKIYNVSSYYKITKSFSVSLLKFIFQKIVQRHESLRTRFIIEGSKVSQKIEDGSSFEFIHKEADANVSNAELAFQFIRPFDLANEYPFRVCVVSKKDSEENLLFIDMHHIICDGVSNEILMNEFFQLSKGVELPSLNIQYKDYAEWQQSETYKKNISVHREYWERMYEEEITYLNLPYDHERTQISSGKGGTLSLELSSIHVAELRKLAKEENVTIFMFFLSLFYITLSKLSNQSDVIIGVPTSGRKHSDLSNLVGIFVNTLALRSMLSYEQTYVDYLKEVKELVLSSFEHEYFQYEDLINSLEIDRNTNRNPLFDVMFSYGVNTNETVEKSSDIQQISFSENINCRFDLELDVQDDGGKIIIAIAYDLDLFTESTIQLFFSSINNVLSQIVSNKNIQLSEIEILNGNDKVDLLTRFNPEERIDNPGTVLDLFKENAIREKEAVLSNSEIITYHQLEEQSNHLAHYLIDLGGKKGEHIPVFIEKCPQAIIYLLGILKAGAVFVPINTSISKEKVQEILEELVPNRILTLKKLKNNLPDKFQNQLLFEDNIDSLSSEVTLPKINEEDIAYIIYTSGSTGKPKGVKVSHGSLFEKALSWRELYNLDENIRLLQMANLYFDVFIGDFCRSLLFGGKMILCDKENFTATKLYEIITENNINIVEFTPGILVPFLKHTANNHLKLDSLETVILGSDILGVNDAMYLVDTFRDNFKLYNSYGVTEATIDSTSLLLNEYNLEGFKNVPIGYPMTNTFMYVLDSYGNLLPRGVVGELYIGGKGVSAGYINNKELTEERFIQNPFADGKMYKTGDLGRWLSDGTIEFIGRADSQIKLRGYRIEIGEIVSHVESHEAIEQGVVVARGEGMDKHLVCYYVSEGDVSSTDLESYLLSKLPSYMVPSVYVSLPSFPLNHNGKINYRLLPSPEKLPSSELVLASTLLEKEMLAIWSSLLGIESSKIGVTDSFFRLGGHSLKAISLVNEINSSFSVDIKLRDIFNYQDIRSLSEYIENLEGNEVFSSIPKSKEKEYYSLSSAQRRMYFMYEFDKDSTNYNMPLFYELDGSIDIDQIGSIFKKLVDRHESLRTRFVLREREVYQEVLDGSAFEVSHIYQEEGKHEKDLVVDFVQPFDLNESAPFRVSIIHLLRSGYILMIDMHHIINDGLSHEILLRDFNTLYAGEELPSLRLQYKDYSEWQYSRVYQKGISVSRDYWQEQFREEVSVLSLPYDYGRPSVKDDSGANISFSLSSVQEAGLRKLSREHDSTMYMVLLSLYKLLLSKLSNQEDIVVGTPTSGRNHADLEDIVGMFVNTLVFRSSPSGAKGYDDYLSELKEVVLSGFEHDRYQYEDLIELLSIERDASRNPLFDVMFSYFTEELSSGEEDMNSLIGSYGGAMDVSTSKFDMTMVVDDYQEYLRFTINYSTSLFKRSTIEGFIIYFKRLIDCIISDSKQLLGDITILDVHDRMSLLELSGSSLPDGEGTILDRFSKQVLTSPESIALISNNEELSYVELDMRSNQVANLLVSKGITKGSYVPICLDRSIDMLVGILGILKVGGIYVPLSPEYPEERMRYIFEDLGSAIVLSNLEDFFFGEGITCIDLRLYRDYSDVYEGEVIDAIDAAYAIYTSGSTGAPKGVLISHESLRSFIESMHNDFRLTREDRLLLKTTFTFDVSVYELFGWIEGGSSLYISDKDIQLDPRSLLTSIESYRVTHMTMVPSVFHSFLQEIEPSDVLPSLRYIILAGEALPISLVKRYQGTNMQAELVNNYGPTEATVYATSYRISSLDEGAVTVPIGSPITNSYMYVLDSYGNLLPRGVVGELYIGGKGVSTGYVNKEELSELKFVSNPFRKGEKMYRTGDLGRWLSDGTIEFIGRADSQIKLRGYRIEIGEIVSHVESHEGIEQGVVVARGEGMDKHLVCYYVSEAAVSSTDLESYLLSKLPSYMVPSVYVSLPSFPLNHNGKINYRLLPSPEKLPSSELVLASTLLEKEMLGIWSSLLGIESSKIGVTDSFFRLGGHSLKAISLVNEINSSFSVDIKLRDIFNYQDIRSLSEYIENLEGNEVFSSIPKSKGKEYYSLSSAQRRMYFMYEFDKDSTNYNMPSFYRVSKKLDVSKFDKVIKELVERHKSLRTCFTIHESIPIQYIQEASNFEITYGKTKSVSIEECIQNFVKPFDLSKDFPYRVSLVEILEEEYLLMIDSHHIINDGVSNEILMQEFLTLYHGNTVPENTIDYVDYAEWQQTEEYQTLVSNHKKYWLDRYSEELTVLDLPIDYSRPHERTTKGEIYSIVLSKTQSDKLHALATTENVTMYTLFLAAFNILLSKLSNQEDIVVGTPISGRNHTDLDGVVGMFVNTLALRNQVNSNEKFQNFLQKLQTDTIEAFDHQLYQYEELVSELYESRDTDRNPLFDVFFSYSKDVKFSKEEASGGLEIEPHYIDYKVAKFDLSLSVFDAEIIDLAITYRSDLYKEKTIKRFVNYLIEILDSISENKTQLLKDIEIISEEEKNLLLNEFNDTKINYSDALTVVDMFKQQAQSHPDTLAVILENNSVNYKDLDHLSDQWANNLLSLGVTSGSIVGLLMNRSLDMIAGILSILKAGAAYLPLNPTQPESRTTLMLEECQSKFVISNLKSSEIEGVKEELTIITPEILNNHTEDEVITLPKISQDDLAYIIYTSGSTGNPKGVKVLHGGLFNLITYQNEYFELDDNERILQFSPYYFDASVEQIWMALTSGSGLVLVTERLLSEPEVFRDYLEAKKVTHMHTTPSFLEKIIFERLPDLKRVASGGEACRASLAQKISKQFEFYNEYGPTEITVLSTIFKVNKGETINGKIPIGSPIANTQLYVLDKHQNLLPRGVVGELYISGKGVSAGYINNKELTEERFIQNPFADGKMYKTGDLVKWNDNGELLYISREDDQVKLNGIRIEIGEIEYHLNTIPEVTYSVVVVDEFEGNKYLVAYYVGSENLSENELSNHLIKHLPLSMIPTYYVKVESFPTTKNGKLDKKLLSLPSSKTKEYIKPTNNIEKRLVELWSELLSRDISQIGIEDNFFQLGGNSLKAITLINLISRDFSIEVSVKDVFVKQTIKALAGYIVASQQILGAKVENNEEIKIII
nr:surfactin non-ribosomal peptide synthetase SrfAA [Tenacibaculum mesophilum]